MTNHPTLILIIAMLFTACAGSHPSDGKAVKTNFEQAVEITDNATAIPVNIEKSVIQWKGTKMRGTGYHEGDLKLQEAQLFVKNNQLSGGYFVADMQSITITDIPEHEPIPRRNLTNSLMSEEFFAVNQYPTTRFEITQVKSTGKDSLQITGNLTIKDITKSIVFTAQQNASKKLLTTTFSINRFDWNIGSPRSLTGRLLIDQDIYLNIKLIH